MPTLLERSKELWEKFQTQERQPASDLSIASDHIAQSDFVHERFVPNNHYFEVVVNEMFLTYQRRWFDLYDPAALAVSEFIYNKEFQAVPFLVSPKMVNISEKVPNGMMFYDTHVAGPYPYKGGKLNIAIILYQAKRDGVADRLLQFMDSMAKSLDFATALGSYTKIAGVMLDGIETLFGMNGLQPLIGKRVEYDASNLFPNYYVLINKPSVSAEKLWVKDGRLLQGDSLQTATSYREADYVLYSIRRTEERTDLDLLPFINLWDQVRSEAMIAKVDTYQNAKTLMAALSQQLELSPDLVQKQADDLVTQYSGRMKYLQERAQAQANYGPSKEEDERASIRSKALEILNM